MTASWPATLRASLVANTSIASRWVQFATISLQGTPAVRTVAFRGFLCDLLYSASAPPTVEPAAPAAAHALVFATDARSDKVQEVLRSPLVELCWYMPETRQQLRIAGTAVVLVRGHHTRIAPESPASAALTRYLEQSNKPVSAQLASLGDAVWTGLSPAARSQYLWPLAKTNQPGSPAGACLSLELSTGSDGNDPEGKIAAANAEAQSNFALLLVVPSRIEMLDLFIQPFGTVTEHANL
ncbi:hypothetical protein HK105_203657 [Polyrhizophydium stewartii]|uniref:Pyridoxamine 5'-phosphate oxidase Alr4036 family FMN-binding domain-containing protein n=1 Tax=Polyrhizophydium stewartii TaxID=2732419 RepID=A0ABR4NBI6_9FUNG|nr:hypothetical protein HK105_008172 [Polyrhizophydium stewartii]